MDRGKKAGNLAKKILFRIEAEEHRRLVWKVAGFSAAFAGSVVFTWVSYLELMNEAARSGFFSFVSLIFSDFSAIVGNLYDFALSILESLPIFSAALLFAGIFFAIWSAACLASEIVLLRKHRFN